MKRRKSTEARILAAAARMQARMQAKADEQARRKRDYKALVEAAASVGIAENHVARAVRRRSSLRYGGFFLALSIASICVGFFANAIGMLLPALVFGILSVGLLADWNEYESYD